MSRPIDSSDLQPVGPKSPGLRQPCVEVRLSELRSKATQAQIDAMLDFVYGSNNKGDMRDRKRPSTVGLSANQVGLNGRVCVVDMAIGRRNFHDIRVLVNPTLARHSKAVDVRSEGCVNLKDIWGLVERYKSVEVAALDRSGNRITIRASGWAARLLQHELDHLDGRLFIDRLADPTKAHKVAGEQLKGYNKPENRLSWPHLIDVSDLL